MSSFLGWLIIGGVVLFIVFFKFLAEGWAITWGVLHGWVYLLI